MALATKSKRTIQTLFCLALGCLHAQHLLPGNYTLDFKDLLPENRSYVTYSGSLTTPPCTEGVLWHVFTQPRVMSTFEVRPAVCVH